MNLPDFPIGNMPSQPKLQSAVTPPAQHYQQSAQQVAQQAQQQPQQQPQQTTLAAGTPLPEWFTGQSPISKMAAIKRAFEVPSGSYPQNIALNSLGPVGQSMSKSLQGFRDTLSDGWNSYSQSWGNKLHNVIPDFISSNDTSEHEAEMAKPVPLANMPKRPYPAGPPDRMAGKSPAAIAEGLQTKLYNSELESLASKYPAASKPSPSAGVDDIPAVPDEDYARFLAYLGEGSGAGGASGGGNVAPDQPPATAGFKMPEMTPTNIAQLLPALAATGMGGAAGGPAGAIGAGGGAAGGGYLAKMLVDQAQQSGASGQLAEILKNNPQLAPYLIAAGGLAGGLGGYGLSRMLSGDDERSRGYGAPAPMPRQMIPTVSQQLSFM